MRFELTEIKRFGNALMQRKDAQTVVNFHKA